MKGKKWLVLRKEKSTWLESIRVHGAEPFHTKHKGFPVDLTNYETDLLTPNKSFPIARNTRARQPAHNKTSISTGKTAQNLTLNKTLTENLISNSKIIEKLSKCEKNIMKLWEVVRRTHVTTLNRETDDDDDTEIFSYQKSKSWSNRPYRSVHSMNHCPQYGPDCSGYQL